MSSQKKQSEKTRVRTPMYTDKDKDRGMDMDMDESAVVVIEDEDELLLKMKKEMKVENAQEEEEKEEKEEVKEVKEVKEVRKSSKTSMAAPPSPALSPTLRTSPGARRNLPPTISGVNSVVTAARRSDKGKEEERNDLSPDLSKGQSETRPVLGFRDARLVLRYISCLTCAFLFFLDVFYLLHTIITLARLSPTHSTL